MLLGLSRQDQVIQDIVSVAAYGHCDTQKCFDATSRPGTVAVIPPSNKAHLWNATKTGESRATKPCERQSTPAEGSGDDGADTTEGAAPRASRIT